MAVAFIAFLILGMPAIAFVGKVILEFIREFGTKSSSDMPIEEAWRINEIYTAAREQMIHEAGWYQPDEKG